MSCGAEAHHSSQWHVAVLRAVAVSEMDRVRGLVKTAWLAALSLTTH